MNCFRAEFSETRKNIEMIKWIQSIEIIVKDNSLNLNIIFRWQCSRPVQIIRVSISYHTDKIIQNYGKGTIALLFSCCPQMRRTSLWRVLRVSIVFVRCFACCATCVKCCMFILYRGTRQLPISPVWQKRRRVYEVAMLSPFDHCPTKTMLARNKIRKIRTNQWK